jgi:iron complex outermembrane receptor protein
MDLMRTGGPLLVAASVLVLVSQGSVAADSAGDPNGGTSAAPNTPPASEVVITGQQPWDVAASGTKTNTPLVETPQSITVVDRQDLDLRVVQNLNEALHFTAGVGPDTRGNTAGRYDQQTIRGFTPDQYLDGLRLIGSSNGYATPQVDLAFLDRVEVLKGPASGLYGQGSPGGIVVLSSKLPVLDRFGEVTLSGGSYGTERASVDAGGRIDAAGQFSFRITGTGYHSDTQTQHVESIRYGISPSVTWRPDELTSWTVLYSFQHDPKTGDYGAMPLQGSVLPNPNGRIPRDFYDGEPGYERFDRRQNAVTSLFMRRFGDWAFHQNTRYMRTGTVYRSVYHIGLQPDLTLLNRSVAVADEAVDALTLDNQLTGTVTTGVLTHNVIVGVDYQKTHQTEAAGFGGAVAPLDAFAPVYGAAVTPPDISFSIRLNLHQTGVYAQDQIALENWRLVLSGRQDWVKSDQLDRLGGATTGFDEKKFTARAGLLYLFPNGVAPYVSYSTSFLPQTDTDRNGNVLPPTEGKQSEAGVKYQPGFWNTLLTAALYDLRQTNKATQDPSVPAGFGSIAAGEVRSRGVELEGAAHPIPALELKASYTYLNNEVTRDNSGLLGTRPYGVPQQTANMYALYTAQGGLLGGLGVGGGVRYLGRNFNGATGAGAITIPGATLFDVLASYELGMANPHAEGLTFNLDVTNVLNRTYISSCYSTLWCWYGASRNVQASLRYRM